jgi:hypothetical protein
MSHQVFFLLNDREYIWDLEKNPIFTVTELDDFEIFISSNLGHNIEFLLEDYKISLTEGAGYFTSNKLKIFREAFGTSIGRLFIDGKVFEVCFEVLAKKLTVEKIEKMLSFLYKNNQEILNICFSRTMKEKSISEFGEADPEIIVKQAEVFVHKFMEFRQDLFFNLKKRLIPQKIPIWMSKDTNNFFEIDDFFENIDRINPTIEEGDVLFNGRYFSIDRIYKTELIESTNTYENSIILGGAQSILDKIKKILVFIKSNFSSDMPSYDKEYESIGDCIARVTYSALEKRCLLITEHLEEIVRYLKHDLNISYQGEIFPRVTPYVRGVKVYRMLFDQLAVWYKLGVPSFSSLVLLSKIRSISKIYELFCLYKILEVFYHMGWTVVSASKNEELGAGIPKSVIFNKDNMSVEIRYEYKINPFDISSTSHLDLVDLDHHKHWSYPFYNPDFVLICRNGLDVRYFIFDAKYSNKYRVEDSHLPDIYKKYYQGVGVVDLNRNIISSEKILAVCVLYPDYQKTIPIHKINNLKSHDLVRLPISNAISLRDDNDNTFMSLMTKLLNLSSKLMQPTH